MPRLRLINGFSELSVTRNSQIEWNLKLKFWQIFVNLKAKANENLIMYDHLSVSFELDEVVFYSRLHIELYESIVLLLVHGTVILRPRPRIGRKYC